MKLLKYNSINSKINTFPITLAMRDICSIKLPWEIRECYTKYFAELSAAAVSCAKSSGKHDGFKGNGSTISWTSIPCLNHKDFFPKLQDYLLVFSYAFHFTCLSYGKYFWILQLPTCSVILIKSWASINHLPLEDKERFSKLLVRQNWKNINFWENTACQLRNQNVSFNTYFVSMITS